MKRIISLIIAAVMIAASLCISVPANVTTNNSGSYMKLVSGEDGVLVYDLCVNDSTQCGITSVGYEIAYPSTLTLVKCDRMIRYGSFITGEYLSKNPYTVFWVLGTDVLPYEEVVIARLTFEVAPDLNMDDEINIGLSYEEDNFPCNMNGNTVEDKVIIEPEISHTYEELVSEFPNLDPRSSFVLECNKQSGNELVLDLYLDSDEGFDISAFNVEMSYPEGFTLKSSEPIFDKGNFQFSDSTDRMPYSTVATLGTSAYPDGKTCMVRYTFGIDESISKTDKSAIRLSIDEVVDLGVTDISGRFLGKGYIFDPATAVKSISVSELPEQAKYISKDEGYEFVGGSVSVTYWDGKVMDGLSFSECTVVDCFEGDEELDFVIEYKGSTTAFTVKKTSSPGDVNVDGKVSLIDVNLVLKHIARWDVKIDLGVADVTDDGKVNLNDVTLMLKYIAKWDVVLK